MNLHRGIQKSAPLRSSNGNADHHNGVVLQVQKRRNNRENLVRHDADSPPLMWVHRSLIDIYRQGQRNNLPPNQSAPWIVNITLPVTSPRPLSGYKPTLSASFPGTSIRLPTVQLTMLQPAKYRSFGPNSLWTAEFVIQPDAVELWYPSALGNPKLYDLKLTLEFASQHERSDTKNAPITQLTWYERVGFRTVIVDQSRYSDHEVSRGIRPGTRFTFEINGKPFYAQGSRYLSLEPYVSRYGASTSGELYGDQEHYNYDTSISFNTSSYPVARFVNEFGFHSLASIYTLDRILQSEEDYHFNSSVIRAHNKNPPAGSLEYPYPADRGQNSLMTGVTRYYPTPNITGDARALLAQWAYASQVFQAAFMASQISYYRLGASRGERNMGAVYWQLNDVWEGTSWSSIEYTGRWKIFHYLAERVQSHVIITPIYHVKNETLDIYVTSDLWEDARGTAQLSWYDFAGHQLSKASKEFIVGPLNSTRLLRTSGLSAIVPNGHPPHDAWLHLTLTTNDGKHANEQFFHPVKLKDCLLRPTKVSSRAIGHNQISLQVAHGGVAAWVNGVRGYFKDMKTNQASNAISFGRTKQEI
ncbi:hypothetical protein H4Q26_003482 [Puccinia striiformis f. sp. tritici PST-130]|nr:hypothetical protein H4Q26_003482 [Puccinia striiformis f. sp. tritici PST-130]